jgi:hypothetical protein
MSTAEYRSEMATRLRSLLPKHFPPHNPRYSAYDQLELFFSIEPFRQRNEEYLFLTPHPRTPLGSSVFEAIKEIGEITSLNFSQRLMIIRLKSELQKKETPKQETAKPTATEGYECSKCGFIHSETQPCPTAAA